MNKNKYKIGLMLVLVLFCFISFNMGVSASQFTCENAICYCDADGQNCSLRRNPPNGKQQFDESYCNCGKEDASKSGFNICEKNGVVKSFQLIGYALLILKIVVPLILIIMGCLDFGKAIVASDDKAIKSATMALVKRAIAGVVIFFVPAIVSVVINLINNSDELNEFDCLSSCIKDPGTCKMPAGGVFDN